MQPDTFNPTIFSGLRGYIAKVFRSPIEHHSLNLNRKVERRIKSFPIEADRKANQIKAKYRLQRDNGARDVDEF